MLLSLDDRGLRDLETFEEFFRAGFSNCILKIHEKTLICGGIMIKGEKKKIEFKQLVLNKDEYKIGDTVRINEYNDDTSFARIIKI